MCRFDRARLTAALLAVLLLSACADIGAPKSASVPSMSIPSKSVLSSAVASTTTPFIGVWNAVSADGITLIENFRFGSSYRPMPLQQRQGAAW